MTPHLQAITELIALRFFDSLVEGTGVCLVAAILLRLAPRQNAATRFALWFSALVAIAVLPWIGGTLPHSAVASTAARHAAVMLPSSWATYFLGLWSVLAVWFALGTLRALWHLNALRRNCTPVSTAELDPLLQATLERHGASRGIVLCVSDQVRVPTAIGLFHPRILIPSWVLRDLSATDLNQILLHELAHFSRWDDWTNFAQRLVKIVFFFHPAVWWIDRQVAVEREIACDDAVLAETRSPRAYAECLAYLAEKSFVQRTVALAQAALGKARQTSTRIAQILDGNRPPARPRSWSLAVSLVGIVALASGVLYSRSPALVAFGSYQDTSQRDLGTIAGRTTPDATYHTLLPVVQARFSAPVSPRKPHARALLRKRSDMDQNLAVQARALGTHNQLLVHSTASKVSRPPVAQTFWVVVESEATNPGASREVYQIQMWRVTVLRTVVSPSRQVFPSQI